jgi:hypothetical protein
VLMMPLSMPATAWTIVILWGLCSVRLVLAMCGGANSPLREYRLVWASGSFFVVLLWFDLIRTPTARAAENGEQITFDSLSKDILERGASFEDVTALMRAHGAVSSYDCWKTELQPPNPAEACFSELALFEPNGYKTKLMVVTERPSGKVTRALCTLDPAEFASSSTRCINFPRKDQPEIQPRTHQNRRMLRENRFRSRGYRRD